MPELKHALLDSKETIALRPNDFAASLNVLGLYSTETFVLRLSPRVHELIDSAIEGLRSGNPVSADAVQAYSTYLHETIHWWQHVGSSAGLIFSLAYPAQSHSTQHQLTLFSELVGAKKPILRWAEHEMRAGRAATDSALQAANTAVNNAIDIHHYKLFALDPNLAPKLFENRYFESVGHSYRIAYSTVLNLLAGTVDPDFEHLPNGPTWDPEFQKLTERQHLGFYYGSPIVKGRVGLKAIFEGQARFIQLQYLSFGLYNNISCDELKQLKFFEGIYGDAFRQFLELTQSNWPRTIDDPLVGLFLLICDLAINPTSGFPFAISSFDNFIEDVDPGIRFTKLCLAVAKLPLLKTQIRNYSREEYVGVSEMLADACGFQPAIELYKAVSSWQHEIPGVAAIMHEKETFRFGEANLVARVMLSHFVAFWSDKLAHPEFFCWAGAWMAGSRNSDEGKELFLSHLSLYSDRADNDGIFPRDIPGKDRDGVMRTLNVFYANNIIYNLTLQWILQDGPFSYNFRWLSNSFSEQDMERSAKRLFSKLYGVSPDSCEILS